MHFQHTACTSSENKGISEKYLGFCCIQRVPRANLGWETGVSIALRAEKNRMHLPIAVAYLGGHFLFVPVSPAVLRTLTEQWKAELTKRNASWGNKMVAVMGGGHRTKFTSPSWSRLLTLWETPHPLWLRPLKQSFRMETSVGMGYFHDFQVFVLSALTNILCAKWKMKYLVIFVLPQP